MNVTTPADVLARMAARASDFEIPNPPFEFAIGWAEDYASALADRLGQEAGPDALWEQALRTGRVLLLGEGGAGKSSVIRRLWNRAHSDGMFASYVDLRRWRSELADEWHAADDDAWRADLLLERLGVPSTSEAELDLVGLDARSLVLIDGINEVANRDAEQLLICAEHLARQHPHAGIVVTDRLVRRDALGPRWSLARVIRADAPDATVAGDPKLLRNAFFLNLAVHGELEGDSASAAFLTYLRRHVGLDDAELDAAAAAAADAYHHHAGRTFDLKRFQELAGSASDKLEAAGRLVPDPPRASFDHHLFHDTLAARWLATDETRWHRDELNALTFGASSFDALALALEQLPDRARVDLFIRRIYDWNYYGAAYALARARQLGDIEVSTGMRVALLAMLAERRWDPVRSTADQVEDALRLVGDDLAEDLLKADEPHAVRDRVLTEELHGHVYQAWLRLFVREDGAPPDDELLDALVDDESLLGWTAANVLRRAAPSQSDASRVIEIVSKHPSPTIRWRAAHVLGAWPTEAGVAALQHALVEDKMWEVKYGAIRSLVNVAALSQRADRDDQLRWLIDHLDEIKSMPSQVLEELERALVRVPSPEGWIASAGEVVEALYASEYATRTSATAGAVSRRACAPPIGRRDCDSRRHRRRRAPGRLDGTSRQGLGSARERPHPWTDPSRRRRPWFRWIGVRRLQRRASLPLA